MSMLGKRAITLVSGAKDLPSAMLFAEFAQAGAEPVWIQLDEPHAHELPGVHFLGNGECEAVARATLGETLADWFWEASRTTQSYLLASGATVPLDVAWISRSDRERDLLQRSWPDAQIAESVVETGLSYEPARLRQLYSDRGHTSGGTTMRATDVAIELLSPFGANVLLPEASRPIETEFLVVSSEWLAPRLFPWLADKWIVVTLAAFECDTSLPHALAHRIHGLGTDHVLSVRDRRVMWSYRSLFEDSAVGIHAALPERAEQGWKSLLEAERDYVRMPLRPMPITAALSCDGLPIAGVLPFSPTTFVLGAFSGRGAAYAGALAHSIQAAILGEIRQPAVSGPTLDLEPCSLRRF